MQADSSAERAQFNPHLPLSLAKGEATAANRQSVEVRFRKWKCIFDQLDARFCVVRDDYFRHIEAEKNIGVVEHSQPGQGAA